MTAVGARKHLAALAARGLVRYDDHRQTIDRPKRVWMLTDRGHARFPDRHSDLTLELLTSVRKIFGQAGLERLISDREEASLTRYHSAMGAPTV